MSDPIGELIWRASVRAGSPVPDATDLIDWAPRLGAAGGMILDCAALFQGFSPEQRAIRGGTAWPDQASTGGWTIDVALAELRALVAALPDATTPRLTGPERRRWAGHPHVPMGLSPASVPRAYPDDLAGTARRLVELLDGSDEPDGAALEALLGSLVEMDRRLPDLDYRLLADGPIETLAAAIAVVCLGEFALATRDLWRAPLGSPALLWRSARLSGTGLGPYFGGVGRVARNATDIYDLAASAGGQDEDRVGAWIVLLSRNCPIWLFRHVADDLADFARMDAVAAMLDRVAAHRAAVVDLADIYYFRDAALDVGDYRLAARAQAIIAQSDPEQLVEREILATLQAQAGDFMEAEATLRACLLVEPKRASTLARLDLLGTENFAAFHIERGFASPTDRADVRLDRRGVRLTYPRRRGVRVPAVDVR